MEKVLNIYKPAGMTPLEAVRAFQDKNIQYKDVKMTYAGRLDPLAEGVLLVLVGDELKKQEKYWGLDKEYEADILLGFSTDTYDVLGMPNLKLRQTYFFGTSSTFEEVLKNFEGEYTFSLPPYSSHKIKGKPLFWWAREGRLDEIEIPQKTVNLYNIDVLSQNTLQKTELLSIILKKISSVRGDFRQDEIKKEWENQFSHLKAGETIEFKVIKIKVRCSSGTFIRSLVHDAGKKAKIGATLFHLKRTKVGNYDIKDSIKL